jgi:hypothetical protein
MKEIEYIMRKLSDYNKNHPKVKESKRKIAVLQEKQF